MEFWRTSARDLLDSKEVKDTIEQHAANPTELDPEHTSYLQFTVRQQRPVDLDGTIYT